MASNIDTIIAELEEKLENARLVKERFPDAVAERLPDGRYAYVSKSALKVADRVELQRQGDGFPVAVTYVQLQDGPPPLRVYADHEYLHNIAPDILERLRKDNPEGYATLVLLAKTR
jgi:hypothetical protein